MKKTISATVAVAITLVVALYWVWSATMFVPKNGSPEIFATALQGENISSNAKNCLIDVSAPISDQFFDQSSDKQLLHMGRMGACITTLGDIYTRAHADADIGLPDWMGVSRKKLADSIKNQMPGFDDAFNRNILRFAVLRDYVLPTPITRLDPDNSSRRTT